MGLFILSRTWEGLLIVVYYIRSYQVRENIAEVRLKYSCLFHSLATMDSS